MLLLFILVSLAGSGLYSLCRWRASPTCHGWVDLLVSIIGIAGCKTVGDDFILRMNDQEPLKSKVPLDGGLSFVGTTRKNLVWNNAGFSPTGKAGKSIKAMPLVWTKRCFFINKVKGPAFTQQSGCNKPIAGSRNDIWSDPAGDHHPERRGSGRNEISSPALSPPSYLNYLPAGASWSTAKLSRMLLDILSRNRNPSRCQKIFMVFMACSFKFDFQFLLLARPCFLFSLSSYSHYLKI